MIGKLLRARQLFAAQLPKTAADAVEFFESGRYLATLSVRDNLIFGRIVTRHGRANERLRELITSVADDGGFRDQVVAAGLGYSVGIGGAHLTPQQRQKLVLAAGLLKSEAGRLLIAHTPTGDLERGAARRILQQLLEAYRERTVICALDDPGLAELFERTVVLSRGQVITDGAAAEPEAAPARAAAG